MTRDIDATAGERVVPFQEGIKPLNYVHEYLCILPQGQVSGQMGFSLQMS